MSHRESSQPLAAVSTQVVTGTASTANTSKSYSITRSDKKPDSLTRTAPGDTSFDVVPVGKGGSQINVYRDSGSLTVHGSRCVHVGREKSLTSVVSSEYRENGSGDVSDSVKPATTLQSAVDHTTKANNPCGLPPADDKNHVDLDIQIPCNRIKINSCRSNVSEPVAVNKRNDPLAVAYIHAIEGFQETHERISIIRERWRKTDRLASKSVSPDVRSKTPSKWGRSESCSFQPTVIVNRQCRRVEDSFDRGKHPASDVTEVLAAAKVTEALQSGPVANKQRAVSPCNEKELDAITTRVEQLCQLWENVHTENSIAASVTPAHTAPQYTAASPREIPAIALAALTSGDYNNAVSDTSSWTGFPSRRLIRLAVRRSRPDSTRPHVMDARMARTIARSLLRVHRTGTLSGKILVDDRSLLEAIALAEAADATDPRVASIGESASRRAARRSPSPRKSEPSSVRRCKSTNQKSAILTSPTRLLSPTDQESRGHISPIRCRSPPDKESSSRAVARRLNPHDEKSKRQISTIRCRSPTDEEFRTVSTPTRRLNPQDEKSKRQISPIRFRSPTSEELRPVATSTRHHSPTDEKSRRKLSLIRYHSLTNEKSSPETIQTRYRSTSEQKSRGHISPIRSRSPTNRRQALDTTPVDTTPIETTPVDTTPIDTTDDMDASPVSVEVEGMRRSTSQRLDRLSMQNVKPNPTQQQQDICPMADCATEQSIISRMAKEEQASNTEPLLGDIRSTQSETDCGLHFPGRNARPADLMLSAADARQNLSVMRYGSSDDCPQNTTLSERGCSQTTTKPRPGNSHGTRQCKSVMNDRSSSPSKPESSPQSLSDVVEHHRGSDGLDAKSEMQSASDVGHNPQTPRTRIPILSAIPKHQSASSKPSSQHSMGPYKTKTRESLTLGTQQAEASSSFTDSDQSVRRSSTFSDDRPFERMTSLYGDKPGDLSEMTTGSHHREHDELTSSQHNNTVGESRERRSAPRGKSLSRETSRQSHRRVRYRARDSSRDNHVDQSTTDDTADDGSHDGTTTPSPASRDTKDGLRKRHSKRKRRHDKKRPSQKQAPTADNGSTTVDESTADCSDTLVTWPATDSADRDDDTNLSSARKTPDISDIFRSLYRNETRLDGKTVATGNETRLDGKTVATGITIADPECADIDPVLLSRKPSAPRRRWTSPVEPIQPREQSPSGDLGPDRTQSNIQTQSEAVKIVRSLLPTLAVQQSTKLARQRSPTRAGPDVRKAKTPSSSSLACVKEPKVASNILSSYAMVVDEIHAHPIFQRYVDGQDRPGYTAGNPVPGVTSSTSSTNTVIRQPEPYKSTRNVSGCAFNSVVRDIKDHPLFKLAAAAADHHVVAPCAAPMLRPARATPQVRIPPTVATPTGSWSARGAMVNVMKDLRSHPMFRRQRAFRETGRSPVISRSAPRFRRNPFWNGRTGNVSTTWRRSPSESQEDAYDVAGKILRDEIDGRTLNIRRKPPPVVLEGGPVRRLIRASDYKRIAVEPAAATASGRAPLSRLTGRLMALTRRTGDIKRGRGRSLSIMQVTRQVPTPRHGTSQTGLPNGVEAANFELTHKSKNHDTTYIL